MFAEFGVSGGPALTNADNRDEGDAMRTGSVLTIVAAMTIACACVYWAAADGPRTLGVVTTETVSADPGIGHDQRERIAKALQLVQEKKFDDALEQLDYVVMRFEMTHVKTNVPFICASSQEEVDRYRKEIGRPDAMWLDWAYMQAYFIKAFVASEQERYTDALALLDKAAAMAPYDPSVPCEKGNVYNKTHKAEKGLEQCRKAYELAKASDRYKNQQALALRGMGFAYVELGDLDKAEEAQQKSIEIEPDSSVAKRELKYIRAEKARRPATAATR